jgi:hypothetical protein
MEGFFSHKKVVINCRIWNIFQFWIRIRRFGPAGSGSAALVEYAKESMRTDIRLHI